ncbi:MAG: fibronectin type III domain-containing protein [bacterium]
MFQSSSSRVPLLTHFKAFRGIKVLIGVTLLALFLIIAFFGISYISEKDITVKNLIVTNVTDSSATVTFLTTELSNPDVVISLDDNFNVFNQLGKKSFIDDRDTSNRYTHHITLTGLNSNSKYYFRVSTGLKNVNITYPALETGPVLDSVVVPSPTYALLPDYVSTDSLVYLNINDGVAQTLSTVLNSNNAFTLDKSNIRKLDLTTLADVKNGDALNFKVINNDAQYLFSGTVGNDQPVPVILSKKDAVLGIVTEQYSCGVAGSRCGRGGTCTPNGCVGETPLTSSAATAAPQYSLCGQIGGSCGRNGHCEAGGCVGETPLVSSAAATVTPTYACGKLGSSCGNGGTCTPGGCQGEKKVDTKPATDLSSTCGGLGTKCGYGGTGLCTPSGCQGENKPAVVQCTGGKQCNGKNVQTCVSGQWQNTDSCDGTTQKCSNGSCVAINPTTGQTNEPSLNTGSESGKTANQPKTSESPTDCSKILNETVKQACLNAQSKADSKSKTTDVSQPSYSDCIDIINPTEKWKCMNSITTVTTVPDANVCESSGDFCNGTVLVNCKTKSTVGSSNSCASKGQKCCVNKAGYADTCGATCPNDRNSTGGDTPTTKDENSTGGNTPTSSGGDICGSFAVPLNEALYRGCCSGNPNSTSCKPKVGTALGVYNQYDPKIMKEYGLGGFSCGLTAVASSLAELGKADFYKTMEGFGKVKDQIGYDPNAGIDYYSLLNVSKDLCGKLGCSVGTKDCQDGKDFLSGIKEDLGKGRQVFTLIAFRDDGTGTIPVDSTGGAGDKNHYLRATGYDAATDSFILAETQMPGVNGRQTEVKVSSAQFLKSVHKMGGTNYWTEVIAPDKSIDEELAAKKKNYDIGLRKTDTTTTSEIMLNKSLVSNAYAASTTSGGVTTYQLDSTGVYKVNSIPGYNVYTRELKILDQSDLKLKFFNDLNGNGVRDDNEQYISDPIQVNLEKVSEVKKLDLKAGWNLINMNMVSNNIKTASDLLIEIARQGGYATHVSTYRNGKWVMYSQRAGVPFGQDYNLVPTEGYFVRVYKAVTLSIQGTYVQNNTPVYIGNGWNLVGFRTDGTKKASTLIDNINKTEGVSIDTVTKYEDGRYGNLIKNEGTLYGQDFVIDNDKGYFIRATKGGKAVSSY